MSARDGLPCGQCQAMTINGLYCHETGCPESWRDQDRECNWCGSCFEPENPLHDFCTDDCAEAYCA